MHYGLGWHLAPLSDEKLVSFAKVTDRHPWQVHHALSVVLTLFVADVLCFWVPPTNMHRIREDCHPHPLLQGLFYTRLPNRCLDFGRYRRRVVRCHYSSRGINLSASGIQLEQEYQGTLWEHETQPGPQSIAVDSHGFRHLSDANTNGPKITTPQVPEIWAGSAFPPWWDVSHRM